MAHKIPNAPNSETFVSVEKTVGRLSRDLYLFFVSLIAALNNRVPITGSAVFAASTTAAVTFDVAEPAATYSVWYAAEADNYFWTTSRTVNGFTANAKNSLTGSIRYQIIRA